MKRGLTTSYVCGVDRHQASEGGDANAKVKRVASLLQQRKLLQRHLRSIQQHALSRDIIASKSVVTFIKYLMLLFICFPLLFCFGSSDIIITQVDMKEYFDAMI